MWKVARTIAEALSLEQKEGRVVLKKIKKFGDARKLETSAFKRDLVRAERAQEKG